MGSQRVSPTLRDPIDGSPPGSPVPGILQARTLEWVAISFQGVFPTQGWNPGFLNCRWILYSLSHRGHRGKTKTTGKLIKGLSSSPTTKGGPNIMTLQAATSKSACIDIPSPYKVNVKSQAPLQPLCGSSPPNSSFQFFLELHVES